MLKLTPAEQAWLDEYRQTLARDYPGLVDDIIIYGPHTRGLTDPDIELRVLVLIKDGSRETRDAISYLGHLQAVTTEAVPPDIRLYQGRLGGSKAHGRLLRG